MNAPVDIQVLLRDAHHQAIEQVNAWRGRCLNLFARGEVVVGKALLAQSDSKSLPMLLSQRITRLAALVVGDEKKTAALAAFQLQANQRNAIVHGAGKVYINAEGHWLLALHTLARSGADVHHFTQAAADEHAKHLKKAVDGVSTAFRDQSAKDGSSR